MNNETFVGWVANLSNGENVFEGKPIPGEKTSWQAFIDFIQSNPSFRKKVWIDKDNYEMQEQPLVITRMRLQYGGTNVISLPYKECDGYMFAHELRKLVFRGTERHLRGIGSVVGDIVHLTWVDENGEVIQDVRKFEDCKPHTTLRNVDDSINVNPSNKPRPGRKAQET